jgi:excisionase family DNA binding protein
MTDDKQIRDALVALIDERIKAAAKKPANDGEWLSTNDAAELARVTPATIRRWVRDKRLVKVGPARRVLIRREDLERLITGGVTDIDVNLTPAQRARRRIGK